jgi:ACS family sodium-dependent inorganic phosphate cotransporter
VVAIMGFLAIANAYTMRICLSTAITEMVVRRDRNESELGPDACPSSSSSNNKPVPVRKHVFIYLYVLGH